MKWKDSNDTVELDAVTGDEPESGRSFSMKKDNGNVPSGQNPQPGKKMPVILVGGGVLVLVVLIIWLIGGSGGNSSVQQINLLETRIKALENRISTLEPLVGADTDQTQQEKSIEEITQRIDWLEAVLTKEIDSLSKRLASVTPQRPSAAPPVKTAAEKTPAKATYHVVQAGENLYRISLRYKIKLNELLRLNNLKPDAAIRPGQKLLVSPQKP